MSESTSIELPKRKRNPDDGELDITPMIDVTFLLLAFFVVVSKMDPQASLPLPVASYGLAISEKSSVTLIVTLDEKNGGQPSIFKGRTMTDQTKVAAGDEEAQEAEIAEYVESTLSAHPTKTAILIKAAGNVKTGMVEMVKRGVSQSELGSTRELYVGIEEKQ